MFPQQSVLFAVGRNMELTLPCSVILQYESIKITTAPQTCAFRPFVMGCGKPCTWYLESLGAQFSMTLRNSLGMPADGAFHQTCAAGAPRCVWEAMCCILCLESLAELETCSSECPFASDTWLASASVLGALEQENNLKLQGL